MLRGHSSLRFARAALACTVLVSGAASASSFGAFTVTGQMGVSEPHSCDGGGSTLDPTQSQLLTWRQCHIWKRHMDNAVHPWRPVRTNVFEPAAVRPLSVTIDVDAWCAYGGGVYGDIAPVAHVRTQTDINGKFRAQVPAASCGIPSLAADHIVVRTTMLLQYDMTSPAGYGGTIRAIADRTRWGSIYSSVLLPEPTQWSDSSGDWIIPRLIIDQQVNPFSTAPAAVSLGDQVFFNGAAPYYYGYLRGALGTWENVVTLHRKLQAALAVDGHDAMYGPMFINNPTQACTQCYTVGFNNTNGGGVGGAGGFSIDQPVDPVPVLTYGGLVSVGLPAHEFGHSMHFTIASNGLVWPDDSMYASMDAAGNVSADHMPYADGTTLQQQESMMAFVEGFGDTMGAYFMNGCVVADRAWGDPDPLHNMWNPANFTSCDAFASWCPYRNFRFMMSRRGIAEGSTVWNQRMTALSDLASQASAAGAVMVLSNNEAKVRGMLCDLLDSDPDVSFAAGQVIGRTYVPDFMWHAAERLDGRTPPVTFATYTQDVSPENVTITLGTLLDAMSSFVPGTTVYPPIYPQPLWVTGIVDGANATYDDVRISVHGAFAMQALASRLVGTGAVTRADMNNILRANRMEELP